MHYAFFVHLRATPAWLALSREQRRAIRDTHVAPVVARYPQVRVRHFDAEAFSAACSDIMLVETDDPRHHYFLMEHLRDSPLLAVPYFEVVQVVASVEDGYREFERQQS